MCVRFGAAAVLLAGLLAAPLPALAQSSDAVSASDDRPASDSYFSIAFLGGLLVPLADMRETHQQSLSAGGRIGWTGEHGFGLDIEAEYSPLSRIDTLPDESFETHFATAAVMPRFTLGKRKLRLWLSAGAGVAYERSRQLVAGAEVSSSSLTAPLAVGAAGLELHPISGVGLAVTGRYARAFGELGHELVSVTGGLVFTF